MFLVFWSIACTSVCSVPRFGLSRKPKPKPNTEQCKTRNRTANRKPKKPTLRFGLVCGLRLKNAQADSECVDSPKVIDLHVDEIWSTVYLGVYPR